MSELIAVFPYGSDLGELTGARPGPVLTVFSHMAVEAGIARLRMADHGARLILLGETCFGSDQATTADLMKAEALKAGLGERRLLTLTQLPDGRPLNNTYLQAEGLAIFMKDRLEQLDVLGLNYHLERIKQANERCGIKASYQSIESVLRAAGLFTDSYRTKIELVEQVQAYGEWRLRGLSRLPGGIAFQNGITERLGTRVINVVDWPDGRQELVISNTQERLRQAAAL